MQGLDRVGRQALGREQTTKHLGHHRHPLLGHGRRVGRFGQAAGGENAQYAKALGLGCANRQHGQLQLARLQCQGHGRVAAVGNHAHRRTALLREHHGPDVGHSANAAGTVGHAGTFGVRVVEHVAQAAVLAALRGYQGVVVHERLANADHVAGLVRKAGLDVWLQHQRAGRAKHEGMSIIGFGNDTRCNGASRTVAVNDHCVLTELARQNITESAGQHINRSACRKAHQHLYGLVWPSHG